MMNIRPVKSADTEQIAEIYNFYVLETHHTFETEPISFKEVQNRIGEIIEDINWKVSLALTVIMSDLPAILLAAILWFPVYVAFEDKTGFWSGMFFTSFFTITFQWLFVGKVIYNTFSQTESKLTSLSLTDD